MLVANCPILTLLYNLALKNDITPNANGSLLLHAASSNNLRHVSSHFRLRDSKRWAWRHPRYRTRTVLDHIFVPSAHMRFILRCFVPSDFGISSDHPPVICELNFCPRTAPKPIKPPSLDIHSLNDSNVKEAFQSEITSALQGLDPETLPSESLASTIRSVTTEAAQKTIPPKRKLVHRENLQPQTIALIQNKHKLYKFMQNSGIRVTRAVRERYRIVCRDVKRSINTDCNSILEHEATELAEAFSKDTFAGYSQNSIEGCIAS